MPRVTALREERGRIAVELDGAPWRTIPLDVAARAGLAIGKELDRAELRALGRELRRSRALETAVRTAARRDLSARALDARLARAGIARAPRAEAIATLERLAVVDDERVAVAQATALAGRGYGDDAIRWKLAEAGLEPEQAEHAVQLLEPEPERARRLVERRGRSAATSRFLARRGFASDVVEAVVAADDASA